VIALTDEQGELAGRYRYDPYGETIEDTTSVPNAIRFAGQYRDAQTGLYKMGVRYYDPAVGRWTQKDPLNLFQDPTQGNRYVYAGADPVNRTDPTGQDFLGCVLGIGSGVVAVASAPAAVTPPTFGLVLAGASFAGATIGTEC
jgi:RHS repeat-associated protein